MAKKAKTEGVLAKETRLKGEADAALAAEREAAHARAEELAAAEADAARQEQPETPKAGSGRKRAAKAAKAAPAEKRARKTKEKKVAAPEAAPAGMAPRSTTSSGKLLSRNVTAAPKDTAGPNRGPGQPRAKP